MAASFKFALVGKFSNDRPKLEEIRKFFATLNLKNEVMVGHLDARHVLMKCNSEADFLRLWTRGIWYIGKLPIRPR